MYRLDLTSFIHNTPKSAPSTVCLQLSTGPVVVRPAGRQMNVNVNIHNTLTRKQKVTPAQDDLIRKWYFYVYRSLPVGRGAVDSGPAAVLAAVESVAVSAVARSCGCVVGSGWFVVRFVRVIRVPACARVSRVSRVCPGSPRCLFTGRYCTFVSRLPPVSFYRLFTGTLPLTFLSTARVFLDASHAPPQDLILGGRVLTARSHSKRRLGGPFLRL